MHRSLVACLLGLGILAIGCEAPGVGDPCTPEQVPEGGFASTEAYLETSSVQCRTRVCMVYRLGGDPRKVTGSGSCSDNINCVAQDAKDERVYCSCRCGAPAGSKATLCECPDGFSCTEVLELGGIGIQGSYCVRSSTVQDEG